MASLTHGGLHCHDQGKFVLTTSNNLSTFLSGGGMSWSLCRLCCLTCRAQERGRGRLARAVSGPGVCRDSGEGAGQAGDQGPLMPLSPHQPLLASLLSLYRLHTGAHWPLISVSLSHCAAPLLRAPTDCTMSALSPVTSGLPRPRHQQRLLGPQRQPP